MTIQPNSQMTTNRYSMIDAFTAEEFSVLYDLVMFHDECPEWMDEAVYDKVLEKVSDVMTEFNQGVTWWHSQNYCITHLTQLNDFPYCNSHIYRCW